MGETFRWSQQDHPVHVAEPSEANKIERTERIVIHVPARIIEYAQHGTLNQVALLSIARSGATKDYDECAPFLRIIRNGCLMRQGDLKPVTHDIEGQSKYRAAMRTPIPAVDDPVSPKTLRSRAQDQGSAG